MLNVLELLEMRREIVNGFLFIGIIYSINYFVKNVIVKNENMDENVDNCDIQLNELDNNNTVYSKDELQDKKEYLMNLNNKLMDIKHMLQDIKDKLNNK